MMSAQLQQQQSAADGAAPPALGNQSLGSDELPPVRNRASESKSPYVFLHADTPVAWQPMSEETLARAKAENKPIYMHIGFLADHLCHITTRDTFHNPTVAAFLNEHFVPIIVDREERPDLDAIYQNYSVAVNSISGWPLHLFFTPDLEPFFANAYLPAPGTVGEDGEACDLLTILQSNHRLWVEKEQKCREEAAKELEGLEKFVQEGALPLARAPNATATYDSDIEVDLDHVELAVSRIAKLFDPVHGGFGQPGEPKFPNPARLSFLLRLRECPDTVRDVIGGDEDVERATKMALQTLSKMKNSGLRDHIGEGFMRMSSTSDWNMPHFEKMVGDNALLLGVYLDAWLGNRKGTQLTNQDEFADVVLGLADYLISPAIQQENGGFISSEAAYSYYRKGEQHMTNGTFYLWTHREFDEVLGPEASNIAAAYWNVQEDGNVPQERDPSDEFLNQNILSAGNGVHELSTQHGLPVEEIHRIIASSKKKLLAHRDKERVRPPRDTKIIAGVNGMVISALSRSQAAAEAVGHSKSAEYIKRAEKAAQFIFDNLWLNDINTEGPNGGQHKVLHRYWNNGPSETLAFADDYAFLIEGLLDLYEATLSKRWLNWAQDLQDAQNRLFYDSPSAVNGTPSRRAAGSGGFYSTELQTISSNIPRLKSAMDILIPSVNAVSASNLYRLGSIFAESRYKQIALETIKAFDPELMEHHWIHQSLLANVITAKLGVEEVRIENQDLVQSQLAELRLRARGRARVLVEAK
ncbi:uncharacterized protein PODANS_1_22260 [Podospora anserina S mat+]|uniref:Podospora anserina S mat+ genomic DNA chromosome 1, supercontig 6 n=1 Tax=Podospora anserina (strain S / ATCC MYA-4624 / DSM 980 / FGSC 10383) TaxID=515849 RepID=B2AS42_PODAN|nr:uncharacterized protein PODANS_1_22260 [Podospora anserina S mat+]CAP67213.1 unnamed protein product [Podospora anserina S mat+]CDP24626.1 Putative protein of unknown function [Podospora anserina S mat+]